MFRPCIDLHEGKVKQIVGGTLAPRGERGESEVRSPKSEYRVKTNFVSDRPASWYATLYKNDGLKGGHIIMLGPGNEAEARAALSAYPGGLQVGGGIHLENAAKWLEAGASHVIVTSWVFREGHVDRERLRDLVKRVGKDRLVLDLSCRWAESPKSKVQSPKSSVSGRWSEGRGQRAEGGGQASGDYFVVTERWQRFTDVAITKETLKELAEHCAEFLVHAVDVEGLCRGIDHQLVSRLGQWTPIPTTYAGGANSLEDLEEVTRLGKGRLDLTIGSALDIFGGTGLKYADVVEWNRRQLRVTTLKALER